MFLDWQIFRDYPVSYTPGLFTLKSAKESLEQKGHDLSGYNMLIIDHLREFCPTKYAWTLFSVTCAMVLSAYLEAKHIHLYGVDMVDAPDWDGHTDERYRRDQDRWQREGGILQEIREWLSARDIEVTHHGPA